MGVRLEEPSASESASAASLADRFDNGLLRLESWLATHRVLVAVLVLAVAFVSVGLWLVGPSRSDGSIDDLIPMATTIESTLAAETDATASAEQPVGRDDPAGGSVQASVSTGSVVAEVPLVVHVVGQVHDPGLVEVPPGARVGDALAAAGGVLPDADMEVVNLAAPVVDGMQLRVPSKDERSLSSTTLPLVRRPAAAVSGPDSSRPVAAMVNPNTASVEELQALPGIGPALGQAIIEWREQHGGFVTVDDLLQVSGIGPAKLAAIRDRLEL